MKIPQKKAVRIYHFAAVVSGGAFLENSTNGDNTTTCTTVFTTTHMLPR